MTNVTYCQCNNVTKLQFDILKMLQLWNCENCENWKYENVKVLTAQMSNCENVKMWECEIYKILIT